jgi:hypothetical protein
MKVIKIGGGSLKGRKNIQDILDLVAERGGGHIIVVSALSGITDMLIDSMPKALQDEAAIPSIINLIKNKHILIARHIIPTGKFYQKYARDLNDHLGKLERLYYGLNFTKEVTPKMMDVISSFGERLSADLLATSLRARGLKATYRMPHKIGLVTDGKFGDATANVPKTSHNLRQHLLPLIKQGMIVFVPGFFGVSENGDITTFGRGGSDYSAAVVAAAPRSNTRSSRPCPTFKLTCAVPKKHVRPQSFSASRAAIGSPGLQCLSDLRGITAQVQNSPHYNNRFLFKLVIDGVRKSLGQHPMIAEKLWMDATIQRQRINIGK